MTTTETETGTVQAPTPSRASFLGAVWVNCRRWTRKSIRNPSVAILELALAMFALLLFSGVFGDVGQLALDQYGFADVDYLTFVLPAALVQVSMAASLSSGLGILEDFESGMFEKVVVTPMSWTAVFVGKAAAELLRIAFHVVVVLAVGLVMGVSIETGVTGFVGIVLLCLLFGVWFMAVSNSLAVVLQNTESLDAAGNLLLFQLLFLSSGFLPASALPDTIQTFAAVNPVTYAVDAIRALLLGRDVLSVLEVTAFGGIADTLVPAVAILLGLTLTTGPVAVFLLSRASRSTVA